MVTMFLQCCMPQPKPSQSVLFRKYEHELLLLGSGESGKSTFLKQMRIIHEGDYSPEERQNFLPSIIDNIFDAIRSLVDAHYKLKVSFDNAELEARAQWLLSHYGQDLRNPDIANLIQEIWDLPSTQYLYQRRNEFQLADSAKYYLSRLSEIRSVDYIPTQQDVLRVRVPTTRINSYCIDSNGFQFCLIDVGGQRGERRKWIHLFDKVVSILFLVSMSEYDQMLYECEQNNRLKESRALFLAMCLNNFFSAKSIILFFNKQDILMEKVQSSNIAKYFPEFQGDSRDFQVVQNFIRGMFQEIYTETRPVYTHFTCATDTQRVSILFEAVRDTILNNYLRLSGLY